MLAANQKHSDAVIIPLKNCSVFAESEEGDLYITYSGSQEFVGIHKFGRDRVVPARHDKGTVSVWREIGFL